MFFDGNSGFEHPDAFRFEKFALKRSIGLADEKLSARTDDSVPRNASAGRSCSHRVASRSCAAAQLQGLSEGTIRSNPAAGNSFHEPVHGIPSAHSKEMVMRKARGRQATLFKIRCWIECGAARERTAGKSTRAAASRTTDRAQRGIRKEQQKKNK